MNIIFTSIYYKNCYKEESDPPTLRERPNTYITLIMYNIVCFKMYYYHINLSLCRIQDINSLTKFNNFLVVKLKQIIEIYIICV